MHLLLFLKRGAVFLTPELVNKVVYAKLLDPSWDPTSELIAIVTS
jgi:tryptophan-rich sensory protein